jgi:hypothetical protein
MKLDSKAGSGRAVLRSHQGQHRACAYGREDAHQQWSVEPHFQPSWSSIIQSGQFYSQELGTANLEMLSRFFENYPEYTDRVFLSVKVTHNHSNLLFSHLYQRSPRAA